MTKRVAYERGDQVLVEGKAPFVGSVQEDDGSEFVRVTHPERSDEGLRYHYKRLRLQESVRLSQLRGEA